MSGTPSSGAGASKSWRCGAFTLSSHRLEGSTVVAAAGFGLSVTTEAVTTVSALPKSSVANAMLPMLDWRVMSVSWKGVVTEVPSLSSCAKHRPTGHRVRLSPALRSTCDVHRNHRAGQDHRQDDRDGQRTRWLREPHLAAHGLGRQ